MRKKIIRTLLEALQNPDNRPESLSDRLLESLRTLGKDWLNRNLLSIMNYYPPYLGAGISIDDYRTDFRYIRVKMELNWWNQNYVGTHFGGSLYSMCDPFYMLMLIQNLGSGYEVWDKNAEIRFRRPGRGTVYAEFELDEKDLAEIRGTVAEHGVCEPTFTVTVVGEKGDTVAEVQKVLHVTDTDDD